MNVWKKSANEKGIALITVVFAMMFMLVIGSIVTGRVTSEIQESGRYRKKDQAFYIAEAGLNKAMAWFDTEYGQPTPATGGLDTTIAPVRRSGTPVSLPGNHFNGTYSDCSDLSRTGVADSFTTHLVNQPFAGGSFSVTASLITAQNDCGGIFLSSGRTDETWMISSTGRYQGETRVVTAVLKRRYKSIFEYAAFGDERNRIRNTTTVNCVNSTATPPVVVSCGDLGGVGSNLELERSGTPVVDGPKVIGPAGETDFPDSIRLTENVRFPSVATPPDAILPPGCLSEPCDIQLSPNTSMTLPPGKYRIRNIIITSSGTGGTPNGLLNITGPTELYVSGKVEVHVEQNGIVNTTGNPLNLKLYTVGIEGPDPVDPGDPVDEHPDVKIKLRGNTQFIGTIYAPGGKIEVKDGAQVTGSLVGRKVKLDNASLSYDPILRETGPRVATDVRTAFWFGQP